MANVYQQLRDTQRDGSQHAPTVHNWLIHHLTSSAAIAGHPQTWSNANFPGDSGCEDWVHPETKASPVEEYAEYQKWAGTPFCMSANAKNGYPAVVIGDSQLLETLANTG